MCFLFHFLYYFFCGLFFFRWILGVQTKSVREPIVSHLGNAVADAIAGVGGIAVVAGDDVAMEMKDGLAGGLAAVHTQAVVIGLVMWVIHLTDDAFVVGEMGLFLGV